LPFVDDVIPIVYDLNSFKVFYFKDAVRNLTQGIKIMTIDPKSSFRAANIIETLILAIAFD